MNTIKILASSTRLLVLPFALALQAQALPYYALVTTTGAKGESEAAESAYSAYYCTKEAAATMFGGNDTYAAVTAYLTTDVATYETGMAALKAGGTGLGYYGFDAGEYSFHTYLQGALSGDYLAVVAYSGGEGAQDTIRVFSATADTSGGLVFDPSAGAGGAGSWATVPEPTSGLLLLLGIAGLSLRRRTHSRDVRCAKDKSEK